MTKQDDVRKDRRAFLKFAGAGTVTAGAALATAQPAQASEPDGRPEGAGYSETEHVKTFYKTARF